MDRESLYQSAAKGDNLLLQGFLQNNTIQVKYKYKHNTIQVKASQQQDILEPLSLQEVRLLWSQTQFPISAAAASRQNNFLQKSSTQAAQKCPKLTEQFNI